MLLLGILLIYCCLWVGAYGDSYLTHGMTTVVNNTFNKLRIDRHCHAIQRELTIPSINKTSNGFGEWWQSYWEPTWACPLEERIMFHPEGSLTTSGDGGKWVCDVPKLPKQCLVYSFGSNGEYSFEFGLLERLGSSSSKRCEIHSFDPFITTDAGKNFEAHPFMKLITVHQWGLGLGAYTTPPLLKWENRSVEMKSLYKTIQALQHEQREIDILKIDIDGIEFEVLQNEDFWHEIDQHHIIIHQLLIEVHFQGISGKTFRFRDEANRKVGSTSSQVVDNFMRFLTRKGFVIFHKEVNLIGVPPNDACEFSMLRLNLPCSSDSNANSVTTTTTATRSTVRSNKRNDEEKDLNTSIDTSNTNQRIAEDGEDGGDEEGGEDGEKRKRGRRDRKNKKKANPSGANGRSSSSSSSSTTGEFPMKEKRQKGNKKRMREDSS